MIIMPYKHCQRIMEDGHRCNAQFYVPTNTHPLRFCPDHDSAKGTNRRKVAARQEDLHNFVVDLQSSIPKMRETIRTLQLENSKMLARIDNLEILLDDEIAAKLITKTKSELTVLKERMKKHRNEMDTYFNKLTAEIRKVEKDNSIGESDFAKLQRQIVTLNNRVVAIEQKKESSS